MQLKNGDIFIVKKRFVCPDHPNLSNVEVGTILVFIYLNDIDEAAFITYKKHTETPFGSTYTIDYTLSLGFISKHLETKTERRKRIIKEII